MCSVLRGAISGVHPGIKRNAFYVSPGCVKMDLAGHNGYLALEEGAKLPAQYALLGTDAVARQFVEPGGRTPLVKSRRTTPRST